MSIKDYLLMRTPPPRMGKQKTRAAVGKTSGLRIALSLVGVVLGIVASFYVTGLRPAPESTNAPAGQSQQSITTAATPQPTPAPQPAVTDDFSWKRFWKIGLISLVICGITYQGLYYSLRLYQNEPAPLIIFVAFQYGYFWQSVVKGVAAVAA